MSKVTVKLGLVDGTAVDAKAALLAEAAQAVEQAKIDFKAVIDAIAEQQGLAKPPDQVRLVPSEDRKRVASLEWEIADLPVNEAVEDDEPDVPEEADTHEEYPENAEVEVL